MDIPNVKPNTMKLDSTDSGNVLGGSGERFPEIDKVVWLTDPDTLRRYAQGAYDNRKNVTDNGSILPVPVARIDGDEADLDLLLEIFGNLTDKTISALSLELVDLRDVRHHPPSSRPKKGWHVDRFPPHNSEYTFGFLYSPNEAGKNTRYARLGSPITRRIIHIQPEPDFYIEGDPSIVYFFPTNQTVHASPEDVGGDLFVRYARFAFEPTQQAPVN